ncbi:MAG: DMT family transporter [Clostridia bacterium]|nr:DMT family transporter [Clostridia bacterium]
MKKAYVYAATSILFWSTMATVSKLLLNDFSSLQVLCFSSAFAFLALFVANLKAGSFKKLRGVYGIRDVLWMALTGLPGVCIYNLFLYAGTARLRASQAFIINYLWPIMSVFFACLILKERLTLRKGLAFVLSFLGVAVVAGEELFAFQKDALLGMFFCVSAAISYGIFTTFTKMRQYDKKISMMCAYLATFLITLMILLASGEIRPMGLLPVLGFGWNGVFVMALATTSWTLALESGATAKISNLAYITPFLSLVWTALFLKEEIRLLSVLGLCIIVLGIMIQLIEPKKK